MANNMICQQIVAGPIKSGLWIVHAARFFPLTELLREHNYTVRSRTNLVAPNNRQVFALIGERAQAAGIQLWHL
jgi:hypothetical protein